MPYHKYDLRIEFGNNKYKDVQFNGQTLEDAQRTCQNFHMNIDKWDWRGAVGFVDGCKPAEGDIDLVAGSRYLKENYFQ